MIITRYINDIKWEFDIKQDYKHKSKPIDPLSFAETLAMQELYFPESKTFFNAMTNESNFDYVMTNVKVTFAGTIIPGLVIMELTKIFQSDPTYPIHIKMTNSDGVKYTVHIKKDNSIRIRRFIPNNITIEPTKPKDPRNRHWV